MSNVFTPIARFIQTLVKEANKPEPTVENLENIENTWAALLQYSMAAGYPASDKEQASYRLVRLRLTLQNMPEVTTGQPSQAEMNWADAFQALACEGHKPEALNPEYSNRFVDIYSRYQGALLAA